MTLSFEQRREIGTERIGNLLLKGWILTNDPCKVPDCGMIYMKKKDYSIIDYCVLCNGNEAIPVVSSEDDDVEIVPENSEILLGERESVDVSKLMGEKLLSGWTMLQECCSDCPSVPLMRSRDMNELCLKCNKITQKHKDAKNCEPLKDEMDQLLETMQDEQIELLQCQDFKKENLWFIQQTLISKLAFLQNHLEASQSYNEIREISLALEACTKALKEIRDFK